MTLNTIKHDFLASITVALVAIPLCLGVALASGVPLFSGILSGIIGGIIVGLISESRVSVSGPAAGMISVVILSITALGGFQNFLLVLTMAGVIQVLTGILRGGFIADYIPTNVIQGLLAAIGILIIVKQIPIALGYYAEPNGLHTTLKSAEETLNIPYLLNSFRHLHILAIFISLISLIILSTWKNYFPKIAKTIPASVIAILVSILISKISICYFPAFSLNPVHLVNIPVNETFSQFINQFTHPDFTKLSTINFYGYAVMIAAIASLETLLNLEGIEKIDKRHRYTSRNRELVAQGFGNIASGLLGGIPITSVIVRSSVNINSGAKTKLSTIIHGVILLISITLIPKYLNAIPLAALAAILIHTGYKLASAELFKKTYAQGMRYFLPFLITTTAIVFSNLLTGIFIGLTTSIIFILHHNSKNGLTVVNESHTFGKVLRLILPQQVTFLNKAAIVEKLNTIPTASKVVIDASNADYIDNDVLGVIRDFKEEQAPEKDILLNLTGFKNNYDIKDQTKFINATTYDIQKNLTPDDAFKILIEGNKRFVLGTPIHKDYKQQMRLTSQSQHPIAVVLSCIDSRVPVEMIFDVTFGDIFVARIAGNIANLDILGSIEFACEVAQAKLVVVLGHKGCGAIKAACDHLQLGHITQLIKKIQPAIDMENITPNCNSNNEDFVNRVIKNNVDLTKKHLNENSHILKTLTNKGSIKVIGAIYDIHTGKVIFEE